VVPASGAFVQSIVVAQRVAVVAVEPDDRVAPAPLDGVEKLAEPGVHLRDVGEIALDELLQVALLRHSLQPRERRGVEPSRQAARF